AALEVTATAATLEITAASLEVRVAAAAALQELLDSLGAAELREQARIDVVQIEVTAVECVTTLIQLALIDACRLTRDGERVGQRFRAEAGWDSAEVRLRRGERGRVRRTR